MHSYIHEYKQVNVKDAKGRVVGKRLVYVGSRSASTPKLREVLPVVKQHNDTHGGFFGTRGFTRVVKD